jgi:hypothetical protein
MVTHLGCNRKTSVDSAGVSNAGKNESVANISVPTSAYDPFAAWCEKRRMIKRTIVGDVLGWFMQQPDPVKAAILGTVDEGVEDAYADVLEAYAKDIRRRGRGR